ncbi:MAG: shikimate dehydrogenase [Methanotrichaceae archaeon]
MKIYAVFGDPIEHSLSPTMQNAAFKVLGMDACYLAFRVSQSKLKEAILGAEAMSFGGLNLTIPLKEKALQTVQPDSIADAIGAINTVTFQDGIRGYNTDGIGAQKALEGTGVQIRDQKILVIGAGGAAKAIAYQLAQAGAEITVANRNTDRGQDLAKQVGGRSFSLNELNRLVPESNIIINATSVGMREGDPSLINERILRSDQVVFDVIYNRKTKLLEDAARSRAKVVDGVMMLVYQGASAIKIWTGLDAPIEVMERAVREELNKR